jgi:hypothetical protein
MRGRIKVITIRMVVATTSVSALYYQAASVLLAAVAVRGAVLAGRNDCVEFRIGLSLALSISLRRGLISRR